MHDLPNWLSRPDLCKPPSAPRKWPPLDPEARSALEKKLAGRLPLSDRPFAFLVTPKLPLCGRIEKSDGPSDTPGTGYVNRKFGNFNVIKTKLFSINELNT